jgi:hypothetical protein
MTTLTIGELARESGVKLETVRYYERRRLLPKPPRSGSGYRLFLSCRRRTAAEVHQTGSGPGLFTSRDFGTAVVASVSQ